MIEIDVSGFRGCCTGILEKNYALCLPAGFDKIPERF
jgi:hypothetical protein